MTQIKITDSAGVTGVFTNPITIDAYSSPKPVTAFGVTPDYNNGETGFTDHLALFPKSNSSRIYGSDCAQWNTPHTNALSARGDRIWFSWKNYNLAPVIANWNALTKESDFTFFHEANRPSGGPVLADYMAFMDQLMKARSVHHNKDLIKIGPCFSEFPAVNGNEGVKWQSFMRDDYDFIGWDFYHPQPNKLSPPADSLALPISSGKTYGKIVRIGEWGIQPATVTNGVPAYTEAQAAGWVTDVGALAVQNNLASMAYWCSQKVGNPNYHVDDRPLVLAAVKKLLG